MNLGSRSDGLRYRQQALSPPYQHHLALFGIRGRAESAQHHCDNYDGEGDKNALTGF
jgi:hypothetical protein